MMTFIMTWLQNPEKNLIEAEHACYTLSVMLGQESVQILTKLKEETK
jgi:hypothetical protein